MNETTKKLLPGRLLLVTAIIWFVAAAYAARSNSVQSSVLLAVGTMWLCIGIFALRRARAKK